ncbi:uncharacterized protein BX663DRAFT_128153 [Cokeromyces recurvatus]|uniref:uncharacterized protein n=1 Tax=Cokeromyces recurvatus TaxID=90255 RepID=UPI0022208646|nr:uncharacterized protein BX663DRAFT_128153 [Cokeromyces recurvatus]KAI7907103.1 hypothetical protein BX663DRAFT_128153 [Cokeromyces recurvatus]
MLEIRNRLPSLPVTKETLNSAPFNIMPTLRYILEKYKSVIAENQQQASSAQSPIVQYQQPVLQEPESSNQPRRRPKKKKEFKKEQRLKEKDRSNHTQFQPPRTFSLFSNPSLKWRFIKIDSQNLVGIFNKRISSTQPEETLFNYTQRAFFECFDFKKLKVNR